LIPGYLPKSGTRTGVPRFTGDPGYPKTGYPDWVNKKKNSQAKNNGRGERALNVETEKSATEDDWGLARGLGEEPLEEEVKGFKGETRRGRRAQRRW
jgi:hypothetical protein